MTEEIEGKMPGVEMVMFIKDGKNFGYDVRAGFCAKVYDTDLDYLAAVGVIDWKAKKRKPQPHSVLVLNKRKKKK